MRGVDGGRVLLITMLLLFSPLVTAVAYGLTADADLAARCDGATATSPGTGTKGVLRCFSFDTSAQLPRTNGAGGSECWGCDFGIMANSNNPNVPVIDTTTKASGGGAMRFNILAGGGSGSAGSWFTHFGPNKTGQLANGQGPIYVQYRVRWSPEVLQSSNWQGGGGAKVMDISLGDLPSCPAGGGDSSLCPTSCPNQGFEFVLQDNGQRGYPSVYANCNGTAAFNGLASNTTPASADENLQNMIPTCSTGGPASNCRQFVANEWMTFKIKLGPVQWNAWATPVQVWFGREGQPLTLIIDCESAQSVKCTRNFPASNGWWFENSDPATYKMGKVYLHPYRTCQNSAICGNGYPGSPNATVWYDELIIATQDIADPGASSAGPAPSAPCCLRLTGLGPMPFFALGMILLGRRWWRRATPRADDAGFAQDESGGTRTGKMFGSTDL